MNIDANRLEHPVPKLALSRKETAEALGVSPITVDRLALRGLLRPSRATRRPIYAVDEIRRFLAESTGKIEKRDRREEEGQP